MKQFAANPDGQRYAEALHALFDLDPQAVTSLSASGVEAEVSLPTVPELDGRWMP
jgi:hypothetical protein